jgi:uncharacterized protein
VAAWFQLLNSADVPRHQQSSRQKVLIDAGPIIGLFNESDRWHKRCKKFFGEVEYDYVTTEAVVAEVIYKIQKEQHVSKAVKAVSALLDDVIDDLYTLHPIVLADIQRVKALRNKYSDQSKLDFADLTLLIAAEDLKLGTIVTIDLNDFSKLRWGNNRSFNIVLPDVRLL